MSECERAQGLLPEHMDGDLAAGESAWIGRHMKECAACRASMAGFAAIDGALTGWGHRLGLQNPPQPRTREELTARMGRLPARPRTISWIPAAAALIAAGVALVIITPPKRSAAGNLELPAFVEIPYLPPLDPHENTVIVRMDIRAGTLIGVGYRVAADPETIVPAEVLVGEDGRVHAVRVLSDIDWNGRGD